MLWSEPGSRSRLGREISAQLGSVVVLVFGEHSWGVVSEEDGAIRVSAIGIASACPFDSCNLLLTIVHFSCRLFVTLNHYGRGDV